MAFSLCNFSSLYEFNELINVGHEEGMCDSTYLGPFEIPVELPDEDDRFFGARIREATRLLKKCFLKRK